MASGREIKNKIKSVQNIRKVTSALQMVSASKIRKAQELMRLSRPYARTMREIISHVAHADAETVHPFMVERDSVKRVGLIVVSTDRGQCGGLNSNQFRKLLGEIRRWQSQGVAIDMVAIGQKGLAYFRRIKGINILGSVTHLGEQPKLDALIGVLKIMLDAYESGSVDRVFLSYNDFINTMSQQPRVDAMLPLAQVAEEVESAANRPQSSISAKRNYGWDYLYEPEASVVLGHLMQRYVESLVYQAVLENLASEQAARMVAMKAATDNASDLIADLTLVYNKARQASITQEISEIVGGAAAV